MDASRQSEELQANRPAKRTLIGGIGYRNLTDMSIGPLVMDELRQESWPEHIDIEDLSVGPIAVVHWLAGIEPAYERVVVITAAGRGRSRASLRHYRWNRLLPPESEIQERVAEAVMGVIDPDNLLVVTQQFGVLPEAVYVIEVEPLVAEFGVVPSAPVQSLVPEIKRLARHLAMSEANAVHCDVRSLGGYQNLRPIEVRGAREQSWPN